MKFYKKRITRYPIMAIYSDDDPEHPVGYEIAVEDIVSIPRSAFPQNRARAFAMVANYDGKDYLRIILRGLHNAYPQLLEKNFKIPIV